MCRGDFKVGVACIQKVLPPKLIYFKAATEGEVEVDPSCGQEQLRGYKTVKVKKRLIGKSTAKEIAAELRFLVLKVTNYFIDQT